MSAAWLRCCRWRSCRWWGLRRCGLGGAVSD